MRALVHSQVVVEAPADVVRDYVTDWRRQGEWIPFTRVEVVSSDSTAPDSTAAAVGDRVRAWTGLGPVGFWDPMTITAWETGSDGGARCEVLHTGAVVRGEGEFSVVAGGSDRCTFVWTERLHVPGGVVGALLWRLVGWTVRRGVDLALHRMARRVEGAQRGG